MFKFLKRKKKFPVDNEFSEDTHDVYAWTSFWNGESERRPVFNCSKDARWDGKSFEKELKKESFDSDGTRFAGSNIYFFGPKES
jgi:hypothetical protein